MAKKSLYIFLTAILGMLMFLALDRMVIFFYLFLLASGLVHSSLTFLQFLAIDYSALAVVMLLGAWYGVWLGLYWYRIIYEEESHGGVVSHISANYFPPQRSDTVSDLKRRLASNWSNLERDMAADAPVSMPRPALKPEPFKRRTVKRAKAKLPV